jgi:hypothetical protein
MAGKFKAGSRLLLILGFICLAAALAGGCVMAARKGEQRLEKRDGSVGHLLGGTRQALAGRPVPTPYDLP